ncbi:hypothetical protein [Paenibacillus terrae]|uniref:hypothetical protein n=1 Tax=Paenibacillus terrae TaxID=159743 RepID=UPI0011EB74A0|nr:hypothetical protein [Paenibacillus terrae]
MGQIENERTAIGTSSCPPSIRVDIDKSKYAMYSVLDFVFDENKYKNFLLELYLVQKEHEISWRYNSKDASGIYYSCVHQKKDYFTFKRENFNT